MAKVVVVNLIKAADLNGSKGTIVGKCKSGRWIVRLDDEAQTEISAKGENLIKLDSELSDSTDVTAAPQLRRALSSRNITRSSRSPSSDSTDSWSASGGLKKPGDPTGSWQTSGSSRHLEDDAPRLEGFLEKRGEWNTAWKWRYFIANPQGDLEYYATDKDGQPVGAPRGVIKFALPAGALSSEYETDVRPGPREGQRATIIITIRAPGVGVATGRRYIIGIRWHTMHDRWLRGLSKMAQAWRKVGPRAVGGMSRSVGFSRSSSESSIAPTARELEDSRGQGGTMAVSTGQPQSPPSLSRTASSSLSTCSTTLGVEDRPAQEPTTSSSSSAPTVDSTPHPVQEQPTAVNPAPSPSSPAGVRMEGMLEKRGVWNTAFKSRYFLFDRAGDLLYYRSPPGQGSGGRGRGDKKKVEPTGRIPITMRPTLVGRQFETLVEAGPDDGDRATIRITVQCPGPESGRTYVLGSKDVQTRDEWLRALAVAAAAWRTPSSAGTPSTGGAARGGHD